MLTEKICKEALENLKVPTDDWDSDELQLAENHETPIEYQEQESIDVLNELICEFFANRPLQFDEIQKYEPIYDSKKLGWIFVKDLTKSIQRIWYLDMDGYRGYVNFEPNRFYKKRVQENVQKKIETPAIQLKNSEIQEPSNLKNVNTVVPKIHDKKLAYRHFDAVLQGRKTFELRKNDCDYQEGDYLLLREYIPDAENPSRAYTGRTIMTKITYVLSSYEGIADGYCILGIQILGTSYK